MSKAPLVRTAVVVEGREPAEAYGVSRSWLYELLARYRVEGYAAFEPRSRRPKTTPNATLAATVELILKMRRELVAAGLDAGPDTILWHLREHHQVTVSRATVARHLAKVGLVVPEPKKKPKSAYIRFRPACRTKPGNQSLLDEVVDEYNHRRPHRSLPHRGTPAALYDSMPKALPGNSRDADTHNRIRHDRIDKTGAVTLRVNGRLHHLGVGRTHARTHVILLIQNLDVRIVNAITGGLLRELTINPDRDYQPRK